MSDRSEQAKEQKQRKDDEIPDKVIVRAYPSTIYLWPSMLAGFFIFFIDFFIRNFSEANLTTKSVDSVEFGAYIASIWLVIFIFNLVVMSFDFSLGKFFTIFVSIALFAVLYVTVIDKSLEGTGLPSFNEIIVSLGISATANFYLGCSLLILLLIFVMAISTRFNYWEFSSNRIIHHKGVFEREESFSAQNSRVITSIDDIFERILFRAGTIQIIDPEKHIHVLRNVYNAVGKDKQIQIMLSVMKVTY